MLDKGHCVTSPRKRPSTFCGLQHTMSTPAVLCVIALLCGLSRAALTNHTIDDASPSVVYASRPILQCNAETCPPSLTANLTNGTLTLTEGSIMFPFTGNGIYIYLDVAGECIFNIDGVEVGRFNNSDPQNDIQLVYHNTSVPDGDHLFLISPAQPGMWIEFDYAIYTYAALSSETHIS
ncbi:hypothetical protein B0H10DRAFT_1213290 [Mycena sp. CBHHK59/15]|nr:hypothetical protein B0H10DRAFT_1213290 [Mycena sp. CBHHK59/15]